MPQCCAVPLCSETKGGHKFPRDKVLLKQWLAALRRDKFMPSKHSLVCKKHFRPEDYTLPKDSIEEKPRYFLKKHAVPSKFAWNEEDTGKTNAKKIRQERAINRAKIKTEREAVKITIQTISASNHTEEQILSLMETDPVEVEIETSQKDVQTQCALCCDNAITMSECENSSPSTTDDNKHINMFRIENLKDRKQGAVVHFYTGFEDYEHFMLVFNLFGEEVHHLKYYPTFKESKRRRMLSPCNEFYLTLIKLRRNLCNTELSLHFNIAKSSVSNIVITWINYMYCKFKSLNLWAPKEIIDENTLLLNKCNSCTVIIDCTEIKIDKPKNPVSQQSSFSTYKSANTLIVLVGISASGCVTFVSDAYGGSVSDRQLFEKCGMIEVLQKGDIILGDRGFNIQDLVSHKDVTVNMPHFINKGSNQFETVQLRRSKKISSQRFHVERVIGLGKTFKILETKLSSNLVPLGGRIIFVCFMLTNFRNNII